VTAVGEGVSSVAIMSVFDFLHPAPDLWLTRYHFVGTRSALVPSLRGRKISRPSNPMYLHAWIMTPSLLDEKIINMPDYGYLWNK